MLILQRRAGESVRIGEDIFVSIISVEGGRVRIAITAPDDVSILRSELITAATANRDSAMEEAAPSELINMLGGMLDTQKRTADGSLSKNADNESTDNTKDQ